MNFNQLQYFIEIGKLKSFSKAASALRITQPALSLQIQKLEEEIGYRLLDRSRKPMQLSEEGKIFYDKALEIVKLVDQLKDVSIELGESIKGRLTIGIIPTLAPYFIPLFIEELNRKFPELVIDIREILTESIIEKLKTGEIDAGILATPVETKNIVFQALFYERFFLYVSGKHPLSERNKIDISSINTNDLWYLQEGNCFQNQVNSICQLANNLYSGQTFTYRSNSIESLRRIVESKSGMTFIPELATIEIPVEYEDFVKEIEGEAPYREISIALSRQYTKKRLVDAFISVALDHIPKRMQSKPNKGLIMSSEIKA